MTANILTVERLRHLLVYNPGTGVFTWRGHVSNLMAGSIAGSPDRDGYQTIGIDGRSYKAHRLAWLYVNGSFPPGTIDHINGQRDDNRICNIRPATVGENAQNRHPARSSGMSGFLGVTWHKRDRRWQASITSEGVAYHLGYFVTAEAAHTAYLMAKSKLHPFSRILAITA